MVRPPAPLAAMRRALPTLLWALLLAGALLARLASPAGWMPEADASGVHLVPCDGMAPVETRSMPRMAHHHHGKTTQAVDHPCAFAGLGLAMAEPLPPPAPALFALRQSGPRLSHHAVAIGRGLAAPPPPATGPPSLV